MTCSSSNSPKPVSELPILDREMFSALKGLGTDHVAVGSAKQWWVSAGPQAPRAGLAKFRPQSRL